MGGLAALLLLAGCTTPAPEPDGDGDALGGTVIVFAAASLTESFDELAADFEAEHPGVDVVLSYGGSAALATQLREGAPADVFAAAGEAAMEPVTDLYAVFATNVLQIAVQAGNPAGITGIDDFARPELTLALCAVEVPCGAAAQRIFEDLGLTPAPDTLEQDVKAVLTKVELGEVDAGLVYRTDIPAARVEGIAFPEADAAPNRYPIAAFSALGGAFVDFVRSDHGREVLDRYGFGAP